MLMKAHIKVVVSTSGNDEEYLGRHIGQLLLNRPLTKAVVTFEEEVTEAEFTQLRSMAADDVAHDAICRDLFINQAVKVVSFSVTRNILH